MNLSESTLKYYQENWNIFIKFLKLSDEIVVSEITIDTLDNYKIYLLDSGLKPTSVQTRVRAIRTAFVNQKVYHPTSQKVYHLN